MAAIHRVGELDIGEDLAFQHRSWIVQRIGWTVMGLILIGAVLGLFGEGLLNKATTRSPDGLIELQYPRFWRSMHPMSLQVNVDPQFVSDGRLQVSLDASYLNRMHIDAVLPQPDRVEIAPERIIYEFLTRDGDGSIPIKFDVEPQKSGPISGSVSVGEGSTVRFHHFVFP